MEVALYVRSPLPVFILLFGVFLDSIRTVSQADRQVQSLVDLQRKHCTPQVFYTWYSLRRLCS